MKKVTMSKLAYYNICLFIFNYKYFYCSDLQKLLQLIGHTNQPHPAFSKIKKYTNLLLKTGFCLKTRSLGQKPAHKDLGRNGQDRAITPKATYAPVSKRPSSRSHSEKIDNLLNIIRNRLRQISA